MALCRPITLDVFLWTENFVDSTVKIIRVGNKIYRHRYITDIFHHVNFPVLEKYAFQRKAFHIYTLYVKTDIAENNYNNNKNNKKTEKSGHPISTFEKSPNYQKDH